MNVCVHSSWCLVVYDVYWELSDWLLIIMGNYDLSRSVAIKTIKYPRLINRKISLGYRDCLPIFYKFFFFQIRYMRFFKAIQNNLYNFHYPICMKTFPSSNFDKDSSYKAFTYSLSNTKW